MTDERTGEDGRRRDGLLTTGEMARLSESTLRTVRFYEQTGILKPAPRTEGGHRLFPPTELDKLRLVSDLRSAGFSLDEIKHLLEIKSRSACGAGAARELFDGIDRQIRAMSARIQLLERLRSELESARSSLAECSDCRESTHFPSDCASCQVVDGRPLSNAARVLWNLGRALP